MAEHLYEAARNPASSEAAVVVLPEIFGMNKFIKATTDQLAHDYHLKAFALDHFFAVTGKSQVFDYNSHDKPMETMQALTGDLFMELFTATLDEISQNNPEVKNFIVVGFCFGGRLAFLGGIDSRVKRVVSFYGARAVDPGFYKGKSTIQALTQARRGDGDLAVLGLFGASDPTIPPEARAETKKLLAEADISYQEHVYNAGHAFANFERTDMHSPGATEQAWRDVAKFLKSP